MKGFVGKSPSIQWYYKDWLADRQLQRTTVATRGVWMNLLMYMIDGSFDLTNGQPGRMESVTIREICALAHCREQEAWDFLEEAFQYGFCEVQVDRNRTFHIMSRRLSADAENRAKWREQKRKQREEKRKRKDVRDDVRDVSTPCPPLSPTPTPTPTPKGVYKSVCIGISLLSQIAKLFNELLSPPLAPVRISADGKLMSKSLAELLGQRCSASSELKAPEWWRSFFLEIKQMPFLLGESDSGWKASLHWIAKRNNFEKILDGNYRQSSTRRPRSSRSPPPPPANSREARRQDILKQCDYLNALSDAQRKAEDETNQTQNRGDQHGPHAIEHRQ